MTSATHQYRRRHSSAYPSPIPARHGHGQFPSHGKHDYASMARSLASRRFSEEEGGRLKEQLRCQHCGKAYKHISSLAKHLWEHTPEWTMTKKLLISKHQQVQLLEAASILVGMNEPGYDERGSISLSESPFSRSLPPYSTEHDDDALLMPGESIPSKYSPMPGYVGGYIDVPSRRYQRLESPEEAEEFESRHDEDKRKESGDDDDEIVGKME